MSAVPREVPRRRIARAGRGRAVRTWLVTAALAALLAPASAVAQPSGPTADTEANGGLPEVAGASVELSWAEVRSLIEQLARYQLEGGAAGRRPPVDALVHAARLRITPGEGVLLVEGTIDVEVLVDGWTTMPLFASPPALRQVEAAGEGEPARVVAQPDGGVGLLLHDAGPRTVSLSYAVTVDPRMGPKAVAVPLPRAGSIEVSFVVDPRIEQVTAEGAVLVRSAGVRDEQAPEAVLTQHVFAVRDPDAFVLGFVARRPLSGAGPAAPGPAAAPEPPRPVRYRAATAIDVAVDPAAVRAIARIELTIHDAPLESFDIDPLAGWELVKATLDGTDEPLRVEPGAGATTVRFPYAVEQTAAVTLQLEQTNERKLAEVAAPAINVHGAYRQDGEVGFRLDSTIEGTAEPAEGGGPADPSEVHLPGGAVAQVAFRFHRAPYAVRMALRYHEPRAVLTAAAERALVRVVATPDGKTVVDAAYLVRNSRHAYLAVTLPAGAEPWGAFLDGRPVQLGQRADRPQAVLVALPTPSGATEEPPPLVVEVTYFLRRAAVDDFSGWAFELPRVDLPTAVLDVEAYLPAGLDYRAAAAEGPLEMVAAVAAQPLAGWRELDARGRTLEAGKATQRADELANALWDTAPALSTGALAARFELPAQGTLLRWHGAIVLPDEAVRIAVDSRPAWFARLVWWASAVVLLAAGALLAGGLGAWAARRRRLGGLLTVLAAVCGAGVAAGAFFLAVAGPYLAFIGFVVAGAAIGGTNLFRALGGLRRRPA